MPLKPKGAAKLARKRKTVKVPPGYIDLEFIQSEGETLAPVHKYIGPGWTALAVETQYPTPSKGGGLVVFVQGASLAMAKAVKPKAIKPPSPESIAKRGTMIYGLALALCEPAEGQHHPGDNSYYGTAVDVNNGCVIHVPYITVKVLKANIRAWKQHFKKHKGGK